MIGITKRVGIESSQHLSDPSAQGSSSLSNSVSGENSLSPGSNIPAGRAENDQCTCDLPWDVPPSPTASTLTEYSFQTGSMHSSMLHRSSSLFCETIPDLYENADNPAPASVFSLPVSSPLLLSVVHGYNVPFPPNPQPSPVTIESTVNTALLPMTRDCSTRSFIHFHGHTAGIGSARRWTCSYCKYHSLYMIS